ncbi:MAG: hypothetical protein ABIQ93_01245 [Saprospiraceae bacterium]
MTKWQSEAIRSRKGDRTFFIVAAPGRANLANAGSEKIPGMVDRTLGTINKLIYGSSDNIGFLATFGQIIHQ